MSQATGVQSVRIRAARMEDAPGLARVIVDTFLVAHRGQIPDEAWEKRRDEWTYEVSQRGWERTIGEIASGVRTRDCVYLAEDAGTIVGVATGFPTDADATTGEAGALYVLPSHQAKGLGRALLRRVAAHLRDRGMTALHVGVLESNHPASGFYQALGGELVGRRETSEDGPEVIYGWPDSSRLGAEKSA